MAFTKKQIKKIEDLGWNVTVSEYGSGFKKIKYYELSKYSNAGEDFFFSIEYKNAMEELTDYVMWFDVSEHAESVNNMRGAPDLETLIEDAREIKEDLETLLEELRGL